VTMTFSLRVKNKNKLRDKVDVCHLSESRQNGKF
jgi:hypothetical protein